LGLAQINTNRGDFEGTQVKMQSMIQRAREQGCKVVAFPELAIIGYPPKDLLFKRSILEGQNWVLGNLARTNSDLVIITGIAEGRTDGGRGKPLYNSAAVLANGKIQSRHRKSLLPTYDVFDEARYFHPARVIHLADILGERVGITVCEDIWCEPRFEEAALYDQRPVDQLATQGAQWFINISASPFHLGKAEIRNSLLKSIATRLKRPIFYVNAIGGQDSLLFDGGSLAMNASGQIGAQSRQFIEDLLVVEMKNTGREGYRIQGPIDPSPLGTLDQAREALVMGVRDYLGKTGFKKAVVGLSGGIDSALTAAIAVDALGSENVWGVALPGPYSSDHSITDARQLANNLGIRFNLYSINEAYRATLESLSIAFKDTREDVTEENFQARIRGNFLMGLSNKFGHMVLSTGNKSELAVGYCTLYGDMCGGLSVLGDVPKTLVYDLSRHWNRNGIIIPQNTLDKPPSAELRENQFDQQSLPPYDQLDAILNIYVNQRMDLEDAVSRLSPGIPPETVERVIQMVVRSEHKRQQAARNLRITSGDFGVGWRFPIAHGYRPTLKTQT
jgi:NAD+ synthetase